jgi:hypothetical protein
LARRIFMDSDLCRVGNRTDGSIHLLLNTRVIQRERPMPKSTPPPICSKCRKAMRFLLKKTGGRKFQYLDFDGDDPLRSPEVAKLLPDELRPLE